MSSSGPINPLRRLTAALQPKTAAKPDAQAESHAAAKAELGMLHEQFMELVTLCAELEGDRSEGVRSNPAQEVSDFRVSGAAAMVAASTGQPTTVPVVLLSDLGPVATKLHLTMEKRDQVKGQIERLSEKFGLMEPASETVPKAGAKTMVPAATVSKIISKSLGVGGSGLTDAANLRLASAAVIDKIALVVNENDRYRLCGEFVLHLLQYVQADTQPTYEGMRDRYLSVIDIASKSLVPILEGPMPHDMATAQLKDALDRLMTRFTREFEGDASSSSFAAPNLSAVKSNIRTLLDAMPVEGAGAQAGLSGPSTTSASAADVAPVGQEAVAAISNPLLGAQRIAIAKNIAKTFSPGSEIASNALVQPGGEKKLLAACKGVVKQIQGLSTKFADEVSGGHISAGEIYRKQIDLLTGLTDQLLAYVNARPESVETKSPPKSGADAPRSTQQIKAERKAVTLALLFEDIEPATRAAQLTPGAVLTIKLDNLRNQCMEA